MPILPNDPQHYATLSAMITPALFLTATGSLIISTSNRMSRIVDRIRVLNDRGDELGRGVPNLDYVDERQAHIADQLNLLEWRGDRIRQALSMLYLGFSAFVGTSITLAIDVWFGNRIAALPTSLSVIGVILMLGASINLVREANAALRSNRQEVQFFRDLSERRKTERAQALSTGS